MHPKETRDVVEVCCRQRIPAQLLFTGARQPLDGRFIAVEGDSLWLEPTSPLVAVAPNTTCTICFQQATSTAILLTTLVEVEPGPKLRFTLPAFAVVARGRQFFRIPVAEATRLVAMVSEDDDHWFLAAPVDVSLGGLQLALLEDAPGLAVGTRIAIELVLDDSRAEVTGRVVRRLGPKLGIQLISTSHDTRDTFHEIVRQVERRWLSSLFAVPVGPAA